MNNEEQAFWDWYQSGVDKGWITDPFCSTHDGGSQYWTDEEAKEWEEGGDPCMTVTRVSFLG